MADNLEELRGRIGDAIDLLIAMLDALDGDLEAEDDGADSEEDDTGIADDGAMQEQYMRFLWFAHGC